MEAIPCSRIFWLCNACRSEKLASISLDAGVSVGVHVWTLTPAQRPGPSSALSSGSVSNVLASEVNSSQDGSKRSELWYEIIHSIGQTFNSVEHVRNELTKFAMARGFDYIFVKNDLTRVTVKCKVAKCNWYFHAIRVGGGPHFQIKQLDNVHTCGGGLSTQRHPRASKKWIALYIGLKISRKTYLGIMELACPIIKHGGEKSMHAYRELLGDERCSFDSLRWYKDAIECSNPNSIVDLEVSNEGRFKRFFVCFYACKIGFENGCRCLLFLDGTFLKDKYKGVLLAATALNGENELFPLAYGVCDVENESNWEWFLYCLRRAVSPTRRITFISDRCKGLLQAILEIFPESYNAYCLRHLKANFSKHVAGNCHGKTTQKLLSLFDQAAYAYRAEEHEVAMRTMGAIFPEAKK
ncbi:hypothetical protein Taro_019714 [Colocasia esculenta]|uniref:MULE transposase domain-containing protein n=1 Tax=Colocasia esculenta TaxID=4460 RepID=A0A843UUH8_COLES|nr:hypothetical protein [Colocasia esculenta]